MLLLTKLIPLEKKQSAQAEKKVKKYARNGQLLLQEGIVKGSIRNVPDLTRRGWRWSQSRKKTARTSGKKTARAGNARPSSAIVVEDPCCGTFSATSRKKRGGGSGEKRGGGWGC
jgi:hypothetical protein